MAIDEHPVSNQAAVPVGVLAETMIDPADGGVRVHVANQPAAPSALGPQPPAGSLSVTGSLATSQTELADVTATGSAVPFSSLAAGPSGIRVQNTSVSGQPNIRVGGAPTATTGVQLAPGQWEIFDVDNANRLKVIYESAPSSGNVTAGVSQA